MSAKVAETQIEARKVEEAVTELYFSLLMLDKQAEMQRDFLAELARQRQKVTRALDNGLASKNSLDEVRVEELKAEQQMAQIQQSRRALLDALEVYMDLTLSDSTMTTVPDIPMMNITLATSHSIAPSRPEHRALNAQGDLADAEWQSFRSQLMPTVALFAQGGYGRPGLNMLDPQARPFLIYGVKLNWNFGQLYNISAQRKKQAWTHQLVELKRSALEQKIRAESAQHLNDVEQYRMLLEKDEEILQLRKDIRDRAEIQVEEGTLSVFDQLQRMTAYQIAEQTKALHELQMLRAMYKQRMTIE